MNTACLKGKIEDKFESNIVLKMKNWIGIVLFEFYRNIWNSLGNLVRIIIEQKFSGYWRLSLPKRKEKVYWKLHLMYVGKKEKRKCYQICGFYKWLPSQCWLMKTTYFSYFENWGIPTTNSSHKEHINIRCVKIYWEELIQNVRKPIMIILCFTQQSEQIWIE